MSNMLARIKRKVGAKWNIDIAPRYSPIVRSLRRFEADLQSILEIGSGNTGISPYLKDVKPVGVDVSFNGEINDNLKPVIASAVKLPFSDNSFNCVISVDMLEHVDVNSRKAAVSEMLRVARKAIFVGFPSGRLSREEDLSLDNIYLRERGERFQFLKEHLDNEYPGENEMDDFLSECSLNGKVGSYIKVKNVNLRLHHFLMRLWISKNRMLNALYLAAYFLTPILARINFGECYRNIYIIQLR